MLRLVSIVVLAASSSALQQIETNIRRSFHAFEDDEKLGVDDNTEHHG
jgi:hypothetical protein